MTSEDFFNCLLKLGGVIPPESDEDNNVPEVVVEETTANQEDGEVHSNGIIDTGVTLRNVFSHPEAHPILLDLLLAKQYGQDWLGWEPETLEHFVPLDFKVKEISGLAMSKLMACKTLHMVDTYWKQWEVFNWCTMPFNNLYPDFEVMQVPTVAQCLISVDIAERIRNDVEWSEEVKRYIGTVYRHDGIFCTIAPTHFVNIDTADFVIDCKELHKLWPTVRETQIAPDDQTIMGEQLRLLLSVYKYLKANQDTLRNQLKLVEYG